MSLNPHLQKTFQKEKLRLEQSQLPIITVSASYKEDVKGFYGLSENEFIPDIVFSRAHYSMALAIAITAWGQKIDPKKAWISDPTNFVSNKDWKKIEFTDAVGRLIARQKYLKILKDFIDKFGRKKLPILSSITPPLLYLTENIHKPILSLHIAAGNILAKHGKQVVQMVTDPHVREDYLDQAEKSNIKFLVFNERTKYDFLEKASLLKKQVDPKRVIVTGPPVDPRIIAAKQKKSAWRSGPLRLCLTTGGLGTNKLELRKILKQILPQLRKRPSPFELIIYAGTHKDIFEMTKELAREAKIKLNWLTGQEELTAKLLNIKPKAQITKKHLSANLAVIYHPQIVDANELLIKYAFPWAHGFITKPSGDMAYDAACSGSFILTLSEWGEWEHNIREIFEQKDIARKAKVNEIVEQLVNLKKTYGADSSWIERAMNNAFTLEKIFLAGSEKIIKETKKIT